MATHSLLDSERAGRPGAFVLRCARVLTDAGLRAADVVVEGDRIRALLPHGDAGAEHGPIVDLGELLLMPSLVDVHVHVNEPGRTAWEGFATASRAAAAGGIGLLVDMPLNSEPVTTTVEAFEGKLRAARATSVVDVAFYGGVVPANAGQPRRLADLALAGVAAFKCFLCDSGLASFPPLGRAELRAAMTHLAPLGRRLLAHAELYDLPPAASMAPGGRRYADYLATRPARAELDAIALLVELARATGCAVHIVHLATGEALPLLERARAAGLDLTVETCPHYLTFAAEEIADGDTVAKCAPPIRDAANREALWSGLERGIIDFVASDHSPSLPELKRLDEGDFGAAWGGIASLQLLLPALWTGASARGIGVERLVDWLAGRPARWLGLPDRGAIRSGARADLVAWSPEERFVVHGARLEHRHPLTPYEGRQLAGVVRRTWVAGREVFRDGQFEARRGVPVRIRGGFTDQERAGVEALAHLAPESARELLRACCAASRWIESMVAGWPYATARELFVAAERAFDGLTENDWRQAFAAHPRLGDLESLRRRQAATSARERLEQAGAAAASDDSLVELAAGNAEYERRFGYIFVLCAAGQSAEEMLDALRCRLANDRRRPEIELAIAADEQRKITVLRLQKQLRERSGESS